MFTLNPSPVEGPFPPGTENEILPFAPLSGCTNRPRRMARRQLVAVFAMAAKPGTFLRWAAAASGARFASSSARAPSLRAFPVFERTNGVLECNELYIHHNTEAPSPSSAAHRLAMVEEAKAQQAAEAAAQFLELPNETPLLLERLHTLRATHPHLPRAGGLRAPVAEGPGAKPFAAS